MNIASDILGPCPVCLGVIKPCRCNLEKENKLLACNQCPYGIDYDERGHGSCPRDNQLRALVERMRGIKYHPPADMWEGYKNASDDWADEIEKLYKQSEK